MAIIDIFKTEKKEDFSSSEGFLSEVSFVDETSSTKLKKSFSKDSLLSTLCVRLFFLVLLGCTIVWFSYAICKLSLCVICRCFFSKSSSMKLKLVKSWLSLKRSFICSIALFLSLLSPSLGIMIACTYFLMYDKSGVEEVVPSSLREQFKDLFAQTNQN